VLPDEIRYYLKRKFRGGLDFLLYLLATKGIIITANDRKLANLKDIHKGQRCFIIGNGPSLQIEDLDRLKNDITFASNKIYLAFDQTDWRPTYYTIEDGILASQNYKEINNIAGLVKLVPFGLKRKVSELEGSIYFRLIWKDFYPDLPEFSCNALNKIYWGSTITYTCIQLACYMGIREIYLVGVDFSFVTPSKTDKTNPNAYVSDGESNHFHPEYRRPGERWNKPNLHHSEKSYQAAKLGISNLGGNIYNSTRGGKLEVFPRIDFDSLF